MDFTIVGREENDPPPGKIRLYLTPDEKHFVDIDSESATLVAHEPTQGVFANQGVSKATITPETEITFSSTGVRQVDDTTFELTGDLTIKDVTKPVTIEFESTGSAKDPFGNLRVGFEGSTAINRKDWDLTWNAALETGGVLVSERVKLDFDISAIQSA